MKKILFLITKSEIGGAQKYVLDMAEGALNAGFEVAVASEQNSYFYEALAPLGINFIEIKNLRRDINPFLDFKLFFELIKIIRTEKPDVVHLNSSKMGVVGALAAKLLKVPRVIFTAHGWVFNEPKQKLEKYIFIAISRFAALFQDTIICVSEYDRQQAVIRKIAPPDKLITIHNGLDIGKIKLLPRKEARARLNIDEKDLVIGTIANFYKTKSLETIILAAISAVHLSPNLKFAIIGDGPEKSKMEELIKKYRLEEHFILPGALKNADQYLKAFDIFILPSKKEGLPYALLEAMAAKTACVVSAVGGIPEIIENEKNGFLVKDMTPGKLRDCIARLIKNKKMAKALGAAAAETIRLKFSLKRMLEQTLALYSKNPTI